MNRIISLLVAGRTGNGNSATSNSILNRIVFRSGASATSTTRNICHEYGRIHGKTIHVVNGPGIGYSDLDPTDANVIFVKEISIAIALNPVGFDAFIITVKFGERFKSEDQNAVVLLKKVFGANFLRKHCLIVMTGGDMFERENEETGQSFREWLDQQDGPFKDFLEEFDHRIVLFDNLTDNQETKTRQVQELLLLVQRIVDEEGMYTNELFQAARVSRDRILKESNFPIQIDELLREVSFIFHTIGKQSSFQDKVLRLEELDSSSKRCNELHDRISSNDSASEQLATMVNLINFIQCYIREENSRLSRVREKTESCNRKVKEVILRYQQRVIAGSNDLDIHQKHNDPERALQLLILEKKSRDAAAKEMSTLSKSIREDLAETEHRERQDQKADIEQLGRHYWEVKGQWDTLMVSKTLQQISMANLAISSEFTHSDKLNTKKEFKITPAQ